MHTMTRLACIMAVLLLAPAAWAQPHRPEGGGNVVPLTVRTPHSGFNRLLVSVTVCAPATNRCATIDDVMVDTGSTGLRLEAFAVPEFLRLPAFEGRDHAPLAECVRFVGSDAWGALRRADIRMGGLTAADLPVQVIDDAAFPPPSSCGRSGGPATSNGTLGIGAQLTDCSGACQQSESHPHAYGCRAGTCTPLANPVEIAERLPNPVARLGDGRLNGVVFDLPAPPRGSADAVAGTLTFGVGTTANNQLGAARILKLDPFGRFTTIYEGRRFPGSYIDSGTETYILPDDRLPRCARPGWALCVSPPRPLRATLVGQDGTDIPTPFWVGDYNAIRDRRFGASADIAVAARPGSDAFVWGAPFFLGRRVFLVMTGRTVPGSPGVSGPFYAYAPAP